MKHCREIKSQEWDNLTISLELHVLDHALGEMSLVETFLYQPVGIRAMNILSTALVLRRIPDC